MRTLSTIARACTVAATLVAIAAPIASAEAPPSSEPPAATTADGDFVLPDGWTTLVDDTNTITVSVPATWVDINTAPRVNDNGTAMPSIVAATNITTYTDTFDEPGVLYWAVPYAADHQQLMDSYGLSGGCRHKNVEAYDDGAFVGLHGVWSDCGPAFDPEWHQIVASPASESFTVILQIQITGPDEAAVVDNVLASFNFTPQGGSTPGPFPASTTSGPPTTAVAPTSTAATTTLPTPVIITAAPSTTPSTSTPSTVAGLSQPSGSIPADFQQVVDDQGALSIHVPPTWTDRNTASFTGNELTDAPYISATPDRDLFFPDDGEPDTWSVPGVYLVGLPYASDLDTVMNQRGEIAGCSPQGAQPYAHGSFTGLIQELASCGGLATRIVSIVANTTDTSLTVLVVLQLTGAADDAAILDGVLSSFSVIGPGPAGGATTTTA